MLRERRGPAGAHAGDHRRAAAGFCYTIGTNVAFSDGRPPSGQTAHAVLIKI